MSYADLKIQKEDHELITEAISYLENKFGSTTISSVEHVVASINPAHPNKFIAQFVSENEEGIFNTFKSAQSSQDFWGRKLNWPDRVKIMRTFQDHVISNQHRLTAAIVLECGKDRLEAFAEIREFVELIDYYLELYSYHRGYTLPMDVEKPEHNSSNVVYKPFGTFACITPFNFPIAMAGMCFGAALTGNTFVWKPSPETLLTDHLLYNCFPNVGGRVFNFTICDESLFGNVIKGNPNLVDGLAFTGSTEVGYYLANMLCSQKRQGGPRRIVMEMGGNNPCIVTPSANLDDAGWGIAKSAFGANAQKCSACGRAVIHESVFDQTVESITQSAGKMFKIGDPRDISTTLGPVIHDSSVTAYNLYLQEAIMAGAQVIFSVKKPVNLTDGYFVEPAIIIGLPNNHRLWQKELFVPILRVGTYSGGIEEAVKIANDTEYGLTAGIFTGDETEKQYFFDHIEAGVTYANRRGGATTGAWPKNQAFGGWKNSGWCTQHGVCGPWYLINFMRSQSQYDASQKVHRIY